MAPSGPWTSYVPASSRMLRAPMVNTTWLLSGPDQNVTRSLRANLFCSAYPTGDSAPAASTRTRSYRFCSGVNRWRSSSRYAGMTAVFTGEMSHRMGRSVGDLYHSEPVQDRA